MNLYQFTNVHGNMHRGVVFLIICDQWFVEHVSGIDNHNLSKYQVSFQLRVGNVHRDKYTFDMKRSRVM